MPRGKPYWREIEQGFHVGYRKTKKGAGRWVVREYQGGGKYAEGGLGNADDVMDADDIKTFDWSQAQRMAREWREGRAAGKNKGPYTVRAAIGDYLEYLKGEGKTSYRDFKWRAEAHILPELGKIAVTGLQPRKIRTWRDKMAATPARLRTRPGKEQKYKPAPEDSDDMRKRQLSANRCLMILKAALNHAFNEDLVDDDTAWRKVKPFRDVERPSERFLTADECERIVNACDGDFRNLVQAALVTGARYGELTRLRIKDFLPDNRTVYIHEGKTPKSRRHAVLTKSGVEFFRRMAAGKPGGDLIFTHDGGAPWKKSHQTRPMKEACKHAKINPPVGFHALRHSYASAAIRNGVPLLVLASNLGHVDTRMIERTYGHIIEDERKKMLHEGIPDLGNFEPDNVHALARS
jgi:integrase